MHDLLFYEVRAFENLSVLHLQGVDLLPCFGNATSLFCNDTGLNFVNLLAHQLNLFSLTDGLLALLAHLSCFLQHFKLDSLSPQLHFFLLLPSLLQNRLPLLLDLKLFLLHHAYFQLHALLVLLFDQAASLCLNSRLVNLLQHLVLNLPQFAHSVLDHDGVAV